MRPSNLVLSLICIINLYRATGTEAHEESPCSSAKPLDSLHQRLIGYNLSDHESPIGDYYRQEEWYSMGNYVLASSSKDCGTYNPWHRKGALPKTSSKTELLVVCNQACDKEKTVKAHKCPNGTYVFYLTQLDLTNEAYCVEPLKAESENHTTGAPEIKFNAPTITAEVKRTNGSNNLHFYCDFSPKDTTLLYTVVWSLTSGFSVLKSLRKVEGVSWDKDFRCNTALNEDHLRLNNVHRLGITISCYVNAQKNRSGKYSNVLQSNPKYIGIEVLNKEEVVLNSTKPVNITMRATVPFGCEENKNCTLHVGVYIPTESDTCELPTTGIMPLDAHKPCGVTLHSETYNNTRIFQIKRVANDKNVNLQMTYVVQFRTNPYPDHLLFSEYFLEEVQVKVVLDTTKINGKTCHSHNDPHMMTFDGASYDHMTPGRYVLYKHRKYETEVQIETKKWEEDPHIALNCAIAIRAGRDVFVYSICEKPHTEINFRICDDSVLHRRVKQVDKNYHVYLPTGTVVIIKVNPSMVNFEIRPSVEDLDSTDGLCGAFDGTKEKPNSASHKTKPSTDLFNSRNYPTLKSWNKLLHVCKCTAAKLTKSNELESTIDCDPDYKRFCKEDHSKISHLDSFCAKSRKKRHALSSNDESYLEDNRDVRQDYDEFDTHTDRTTDVYYTTRQTKESKHRHTVMKKSVYDDESAKTDCMERLNTTVFQKCSKFPDLDLTPYIDDCIADAKISGSMEWASTHLEAIKGKCLYHVRVNQPLSKEAQVMLEDASSNETDTMNGSFVVNTTRSDETFTFTEELFEEIANIVCPNECSGNGRCDKGICTCDDGYIDVDCSVDANQAPVMRGIPDRGLCDRQQRLCKQTSVYGEQIVESEQLKCKITPFMVNGNSELTPTKSIVVPAETMSIAEVKCPLEMERQKREVSGIILDEAIASGYKIAISNNGQEFSDEDILVVFDSRCVDCSKKSGKVLCKQKSGFCVRKSNCYQAGDKMGCSVCGGEADNLKWIPGENCSGLYVPRKKYWIIAAVIAPFTALVVLITTMMYCKTRQRGKGSSKVDLHVPEKNHDDKST